MRFPLAMTVTVTLLALLTLIVTVIGFSVAAMELVSGLALGNVSVLGETVIPTVAPPACEHRQEPRSRPSARQIKAKDRNPRFLPGMFPKVSIILPFVRSPRLLREAYGAVRV